MLDELRQATLLGGLDLALVLAQLGGNPRQAEARVHVLLGAAGDPARAAKQAVLVQAQAPVNRPLPHDDVVFLIAREIHQR